MDFFKFNCGGPDIRGTSQRGEREVEVIFFYHPGFGVEYASGCEGDRVGDRPVVQCGNSFLLYRDSCSICLPEVKVSNTVFCVW